MYTQFQLENTILCYKKNLWCASCLNKGKVYIYFLIWFDLILETTFNNIINTKTNFLFSNIYSQFLSIASLDVVVLHPIVRRSAKKNTTLQFMMPIVFGHRIFFPKLWLEKQSSNASHHLSLDCKNVCQSIIKSWSQNTNVYFWSS